MSDILYNVVDMLGPIAIIALLSSAYGTLQHALVSEKITQTLLGAIFGIAAFLEMHAPIEPFEGLIIDLRNVPVALAGAFLGFRGLAICLLIGCFSRLGLGGVGAISGVAAMVIAGFAGFFWAQIRDQVTGALWRKYLILSGFMSTHLCAVVLLPTDLAIWFLFNAAMPLLVLNFLCVTLVAALLDREARLLRTRLIVESVSKNRSLTPFYSPEQLRHDLIRMRTTEGVESASAILALKLHHLPWLAHTFGHTSIATIFCAIRNRLKSRFVHSDWLAVTHDGVLLLPVTSTEALEIGCETEPLVHILTKDTYDLGDGDRTRIKLSGSLKHILAEDPLRRLDFANPGEILPFHNKSNLKKKVTTNEKTQQMGPAITLPLQSSLFRKADVLMRLGD